MNTAEVATPVAPVTAVFAAPAKVPDAPLAAGAVKTTVAPTTGLLLLSVTNTFRGLEKATPGAAVCGVPLTTPRLAAGPATFVMVTVVESAPAVAEIWYWPTSVLAVAVTLATPDAFVTAVTADSMAPGWLAGAAKVTTTPGTGLAEASVTVAARVDVALEPATSDCGVAVSTIADGSVLVNEKVAVPPIPEAVAATVYVPPMEFAVAVTEANPLESVTAGIESTAAAPLLGTTVNVTVAPTAGPLTPSTLTVKGEANEALIGAVWTAPAVAVTDPGRGPMLVKLKAWDAPFIEAVTT